MNTETLQFLVKRIESLARQYNNGDKHMAGRLIKIKSTLSELDINIDIKTRYDKIYRVEVTYGEMVEGKYLDIILPEEI